MKILSVLSMIMALCSCKKDAVAKSNAVPTGLTPQYARLTNLNQDSAGNRYFWETNEFKSESMSYQEMHKYFGLRVPSENELKVQPFDFNVINHLIQQGWHLEAVSATPPTTDAARHVSFGSSQVYHFTRLKGQQASGGKDG